MYHDITKLVDRINAHKLVKITLPRVILSGNHSSGKSKLLEVISGAGWLPQGPTHCPIEFRFRKGEVWRGTVRVRLEYDEFGNKFEAPIFLDVGAAADSYEFLKLINEAYEVIFGRKNQEYISPYNPNTIEIYAEGASITMDVVDLPGLVQIEEYKSATLEMTSRYLSKVGSIFLAVISCKDSMENQPILTLLKEVPNNCEVVGVLTKPDTIEPGCHESWITVLNDQWFRISNGYFLVGSMGGQKEHTMSLIDDNKSWENLTNKNSIGQSNLLEKIDNICIYLNQLINPPIQQLRAIEYIMCCGDILAHQLDNIELGFDLKASSDVSNISDRLREANKITAYRLKVAIQRYFIGTNYTKLSETLIDSSRDIVDKAFKDSIIQIDSGVDLTTSINHKNNPCKILAKEIKHLLFDSLKNSYLVEGVPSNLAYKKLKPNFINNHKETSLTNTELDPFTLVNSILEPQAMLNNHRYLFRGTLNILLKYKLLEISTLRYLLYFAANLCSVAFTGLDLTSLICLCFSFFIVFRRIFHSKKNVLYFFWS